MSLMDEIKQRQRIDDSQGIVATVRDMEQQVQNAVASLNPIVRSLSSLI